MIEDAPSTTPPKKKHGCLKACGLIFIILILLIGVTAAFAFRLPQKYGLIKSPAQKLLSGTPDRAGAEVLLKEVQTAGLSTKGVSLYVLPIRGTDKTMAVAILDASQGFQLTSGGGSDPMSITMTKLVATKKAEELKVDRVAIEYHDESGAALITMTAGADAIRGFARGSLTRDQFMKAVDGQMNIPAVVERSAVHF